MKYLPLAGALLAIAIPAHAQVYRCTASGGAITYQEIPCPDSAPGKTMGHIPSEFPAVNHAERNRLLQREAALEARMLERERIESAERIARYDLAVREREAKAAREAIAEREMQVAIPAWFVGGRPYRPQPRPQPLHRRPFQAM